jgi:hypothetical protein
MKSDKYKYAICLANADGDEGNLGCDCAVVLLTPALKATMQATLSRCQMLKDEDETFDSLTYCDDSVAFMSFNAAYKAFPSLAKNARDFRGLLEETAGWFIFESDTDIKSVLDAAERVELERMEASITGAGAEMTWTAIVKCSNVRICSRQLSRETLGAVFFGTEERT